MNKSYTEGYNYDTWMKDAGNNSTINPDEWWSIEYHLKPGTQGSGDSLVEVWIYDPKGNANKVLTQNNIELRNSTETIYKYNRVILGGNISKAYSFDSDNMITYYHVDDFIIHSSRIGPNYFAILNIPNPPTGLRIAK